MGVVLVESVVVIESGQDLTRTI